MAWPRSRPLAAAAALFWASLPRLVGAPPPEGAFLSEELPLRVLSVIPTQRPGQSTRLVGRTALTVIFSRAVVALGEDWSGNGTDGALPDDLVPFNLTACEGGVPFAVPGKLRWSTTAIARFDADVDWPTDLCFDLVVRPGLRTFDGLGLSSRDGAATSAWRFTTPGLSVQVSSVQSEVAWNLTDGRWTADPLPGDPSYARGARRAYEVPPDAVVRLAFSSDVDHGLAFEALRAANAGLLGAKGNYEECGRRCLGVRPRGLVAGREYNLTFPAGGRYSKIAGSAGKAQSVRLTGLLPFAFPFLSGGRGGAQDKPALRYRRYQLYLRHGLAPEESTEIQLRELRKAMTLSDAKGGPLNFSLSLRDNATLQLKCPGLMPGRRYSLQVSGRKEVKDGFGQPLQEGNLEFETQGWPDLFQDADADWTSQPARFREFTGQWWVLSAGVSNYDCSDDADGPMPITAPPPPPLDTANPPPPPPPSIMPPPPPPVAAQSMESPAIEAEDFETEESERAPLAEPQPPPPRRLCDRRPFELNAWPVAEEDVPKAVAMVYGSIDSQTFSKRGMQTVQSPNTKELQVLGIDAEKLLLAPHSGPGSGRGGIFLRELRRNGFWSRGLVSVADFGVSLVAMPGELLVWATSFDSGSAVQGAEVTVYSIRGDDMSDVSVIANGTSGKDGTVTLSAENKTAWSDEWPSRMVAVVRTAAGGLTVSTSVPSPLLQENPLTSPLPLRAELVTDRAIYRPGDSVYVKGYVRLPSADSTGYTLPPRSSAFAIEVNWKADGQEASTQRVSAPFVSKYGTLSAELTVPQDQGAVTYGSVELNLVKAEEMDTRQDGIRPNPFVGSTTVTIADPRPPTVALEISTTADVILPGADAMIDLDVRTSTYTGVGVEGAEVTLTWTLRRMQNNGGPRPPVPLGRFAAGGAEVVGVRSVQPASLTPFVPAAEGEVAGEVRVVTGPGGKATASLSLASLLAKAGPDGGPAAPAAEEDTLSVAARWVGPTREVVTAELPGGPVRVSRSPYVLAITPSRTLDEFSGAPLPGTPFSVYVDVRDKGGASMNQTSVELSLFEWDGRTPVGEDLAEGGEVVAGHRGGGRGGTWGKQVGHTCNATADGGSKAQCVDALTLPAARKYLVRARALDPHGVELVTAFPVGRTAEEWSKWPLAMLDDTFAVRPDKRDYAVGDTASLSLVSPFQDATALVVWGGGGSRRSKQQRLEGPPGKQHAIAVQLGEEECRFGCGVLVVLQAPTQPRAAMLPVEVPVSPLLDVTLPRTVTATAQLSVPDTGRNFAEDSIRVVVAKAGGSESQGSPRWMFSEETFEPGDEAAVLVTLPAEEAGSEVCVFVVDQAMLDVGGAANPHPLANLNDSFAIRREGVFSVEDTRNGLAAFDGYQQTPEMALRRAEIDPWAVDTNWPLLSNSGVGQSEADLALLTDDATHFPASTYGMWMNAMNGPPIAMEMDMAMDAAPMMETASLAEAPMMRSKSIGDPSAGPTTTMMPPPPPPPPPPPAGQAPGAAAQPPGKAVYTRASFVTTPLFAASVALDKRGAAEVPFKLPDNVGTFEVRVYVVDGRKQHRFGQASTQIVSQRSVSMQPSMPRVVRPGDRFECGVTVTSRAGKEGAAALPDGGVNVTAQVQDSNTSLALRQRDLRALGAAKAAGGATAALEAPGSSGPHEVVFPFEVPPVSKGGGLGSATVRFQVSVGDDVLDAMEAPVAVKATQGQVVVADSFVLSGHQGAAASATEGLALPEAAPGSGELRLTAGVGYQPSVATHAADLLARKPTDGQTIAAQLLPSAAFGLYRWSVASSLDSAATAFQRAVRELPLYTDQYGYPPMGLMWRADDIIAIPRDAMSASVTLNSFGILAARIVETSNGAGKRSVSKGENLESPSLKLPSSFAQLVESWKGALEQELARQVRQARKHSKPRCTSDCFHSWETLAQVRAALGFEWDAPSSKADRRELSMDRLFSNKSLGSLSPLGLARAALAYTLHGHPQALPREAPGRLDQIYSRLSRLLRVQGRTAYVAAGAGSQHSAGLEANAAALLAMALAGDGALAKHFAGDASTSLAAKVGQYVAAGGGVGATAYAGRAGVRGLALACAALSRYDQALGSTKPDINVSAVSGDVEVLDFQASGAKVDPVTQLTLWEQLPRPPAPVRFSASGRGQASVSAVLTFVPAAMPIAGAVYRGLYVEKIVRRMNATTGDAVGPPLQVVPLGVSVVITIQVTTPDDVSRVVVTDLSAGGLEPVDPNVAGDDSGAGAGDECRGGGYRWSWWCVPAFYHRETYADRVTWTSWSTLPAGTHTVTYQAVAATRGVFSLPPAHALVDDQPELMGLSQAGTIVVVDNSQETPDTADPDGLLKLLGSLGVEPSRQVQPKSCPGGCPNGGVCQVSTGTCVCYKDFAFVDGDCSLNETFGEKVALLDVTGIGGEEMSWMLPGGVLVAMATTLLFIAAVLTVRVHKTRGCPTQDSSGSCCPYGALASQDIVQEQELSRVV